MAITSEMYQDLPKHWQPEMTKIVDDRAVRFRDVVVHTCHIGDVEDPDLMLGQHLWTWQTSEQGQWIMENAVDRPYWHRQITIDSFGYKYSVVARLSEQNETFWRLKWGSK